MKLLPNTMKLSIIQYLPKPLLTVESGDYNIIILQCHIIYNIYRLTYNHFVLSQFKINQ